VIQLRPADLCSAARLHRCLIAAARIRYQTIEFGNVDIHLRTLRDLQQFSDDQGQAAAAGINSASWPMFGVVWASSEVLARLMWHYDIADQRILEVGSGIGLTSLVLSHRQADITATDHHPEAADFLQKNALLNQGREIPFVRTGWGDDDQSLGTFDLIVGSDLLYERDHPELLAGFINTHANANCTVIITDPGRRHRGDFSRRMRRLGYSDTQSRSINTEAHNKPYSGYILQFSR